MAAKTKFTIINLAGLLVALILYINMSHQPFSFQLFGVDLAFAPGVLLVISYVAGALIGAGSVVPFIGHGQVENVAKLKEWQQQDAKLALEVQSDREKQLEAKIATLESALKQALKKYLDEVGVLSARFLIPVRLVQDCLRSGAG
jgi:hypothetical protein